jgi:isopentenyl diphosphate isomerase/L-lactate dehydrogenase-like FMN-dependent dehydrogenase
VREVKECRKELSATLARRAPRRITDLASKCEQMTGEILQLLEHVGAKENINTARKVFWALKERKAVEKIQNPIKEKEKLLESLLVQDIWYVLAKNI